MRRVQPDCLGVVRNRRFQQREGRQSIASSHKSVGVGRVQRNRPGVDLDGRLILAQAVVRLACALQCRREAACPPNEYRRAPQVRGCQKALKSVLVAAEHEQGDATIAPVFRELETGSGIGIHVLLGL